MNKKQNAFDIENINKRLTDIVRISSTEYDVHAGLDIIKYRMRIRPSTFEAELQVVFNGRVWTEENITEEIVTLFKFFSAKEYELRETDYTSKRNKAHDFFTV